MISMSPLKSQIHLPSWELVALYDSCHIPGGPLNLEVVVGAVLEVSVHTVRYVQHVRGQNVTSAKWRAAHNSTGIRSPSWRVREMPVHADPKPLTRGRATRPQEPPKLPFTHPPCPLHVCSSADRGGSSTTHHRGPSPHSECQLLDT